MATFLGYETLRLDELIPFPGNARRGDVDKIRESIRAHDQYRSLVVRRTPGGDVILAGNHTAQALIAEGRADARCEVLECSESDAIKINLMDNKGSDDATNDDDALGALLSELDGDYFGTGFDEDEANTILAALTAEELATTGGGDMNPFIGDAPVDEMRTSWGVVVTCRDELQQVELLQRFTAEGLSVRALVA
jgi:ParB-like chromosome segregation protein Spo0J